MFVILLHHLSSFSAHVRCPVDIVNSLIGVWTQVSSFKFSSFKVIQIYLTPAAVTQAEHTDTNFVLW